MPHDRHHLSERIAPRQGASATRHLSEGHCAVGVREPGGHFVDRPGEAERSRIQEDDDLSDGGVAGFAKPRRVPAWHTLAAIPGFRPSQCARSSENRRRGACSYKV
jgi:hypothetical protein